jgi:glucose-6-phosphate 1-dehydrogenase
VITAMLLFGATGDLAGRFLMPALARLHASGHIPADFRLVGTGRESWDDAAFRGHAARKLEEQARDLDDALRRAFVRCLRYRPVDFTDLDSVARVLAAAVSFDQPAAESGGEPEVAADPVGSTDPVVAYLALPAAVFPAAVQALGDVGLPTGSRIVLEKPFGEDLDSAVRLNEMLARVAGVAGELAVFRVDHVLGMATVQNLLAVRLANRLFEPVWNSLHIEEVELLWEETLGLEGRANFYDRTGALKDVIQNHLLQVLCLVAMEPPVSMGERDLRDRKLDVLRSVRPPTETEVAGRTRRARYTAGRLSDTGGADGAVVPGYAQEEGIDQQRGTETFAEVILEVENWRWSGTRFVLRAGKAMAARRKQVVIHFRMVPDLPFGDGARHPAANELRIGLDGPYDLTLALTGTASGPPTQLVALPFTAQLAAPDLPAYGRVLMDVLAGDSTLSIRGDEAEQAWRILTPVTQAWADNQVPLLEYRAGSPGPTGN